MHLFAMGTEFVLLGGLKHADFSAWVVSERQNATASLRVARCRRTHSFGSFHLSALSPVCLGLSCPSARICPQLVLGLSSSRQCRRNTANAAPFAPRPSTPWRAWRTMRAALNISSRTVRMPPTLGLAAHERVLPMQRMLTDQPQQIHRHRREGTQQVAGVELANGRRTRSMSVLNSEWKCSCVP